MVSAISGSLNIELLISLLENSKVQAWASKTSFLRQLIKDDISAILTSSRTKRFYLHRALLQFHKHREMHKKEEVVGFISLNYDGVLDQAYKLYYGPPRVRHGLAEPPLARATRRSSPARRHRPQRRDARLRTHEGQRPPRASSGAKPTRRAYLLVMASSVPSCAASESCSCPTRTPRSGRLTACSSQAGFSCSTSGPHRGESACRGDRGSLRQSLSQRWGNPLQGSIRDARRRAAAGLPRAGGVS